VTVETPEKLGVLILDLSKGFGWDPSSREYVLVERIRRLKEAAYAAGVQVFHVNSLRRPTDKVLNERPMVGTPGVDVIDEMLPIDRDILIYKRYFSGFSHNDLDYTLRTMGIQKVLICGASTHNCVLWTSADAHQNRYGVVVIEDCTAVHRATGAEEAQADAMRIIRNVVHAEVLSLDETIAKYLPARQAGRDAAQATAAS
jgi:nicotinamidase-related amidase